MPWFRNLGTGVIAHDNHKPEWGGEWEPIEGPTLTPSPAAVEVVATPVEDHEPVEEPAPVGVPPTRATVAVWEAYATSIGVKVPEGSTKAEIRALVEATERG